jgi:RNA polymerase sigma-70 factor (ECF subfamily)
VLLRLHLVNGLTVEAIGKMYGVSQPTASRWLAAARATLLDDIKATLAARLGASSEELASLAGLVASRLDLSLSALLRSR